MTLEVFFWAFGRGFDSIFLLFIFSTIAFDAFSADSSTTIVSKSHYN